MAKQQQKAFPIIRGSGPRKGQVMGYGTVLVPEKRLSALTAQELYYRVGFAHMVAEQAVKKLSSLRGGDCDAAEFALGSLWEAQALLAGAKDALEPFFSVPDSYDGEETITIERGPRT